LKFGGLIRFEISMTENPNPTSLVLNILKPI